MNKNLAQVIILQAHYLNVYKWIRTNMFLGIKESMDLSKSRVIDFYGDYNKAVEFYNYLKSFPRSSTKLIIDVNCEIPQIPSANVYTEEDIEEDIKFNAEWDENE